LAKAEADVALIQAKVILSIRIKKPSQSDGNTDLLKVYKKWTQTRLNGAE
jgi:hypothetical protein